MSPLKTQEYLEQRAKRGGGKSLIMQWLKWVEQPPIRAMLSLSVAGLLSR